MKSFNLLTGAFCALLAMGCTEQSGSATAARFEPTSDFAVFWPRVRTAFLEADPDAMLALSYGGFLNFRYTFVDLDTACERQTVKAYLTALLDAPIGRPGGTTWREYLERTPTLDLDTRPDIYVNALGEYAVQLKVRFRPNRSSGAWEIVDMLANEDRLFSFSERAGGPSTCR